MLIDFIRIPFSADGLFGDSQYKELSNCVRCHRLVGCAAECDGLEDLPSARTLGNATHLAPGFRGRAGDKLQGQGSNVAALLGSLSKRDLHFFKELLPLRLWKTNDQPGEARQ